MGDVAKRVIGRPFPKGVSGNPGGRAKLTEEQRKAHKLGKKLVLQALRKLWYTALTTTDDAVRARIMLAIVDRWAGEDDDAPALASLPIEERLRLMERATKQLRREVAEAEDDDL